MAAQIISQSIPTRKEKFCFGNECPPASPSRRPERKGEERKTVASRNSTGGEVVKILGGHPSCKGTTNWTQFPAPLISSRNKRATEGEPRSRVTTFGPLQTTPARPPAHDSSGCPGVLFQKPWSTSPHRGPTSPRDHGGWLRRYAIFLEQSRNSSNRALFTGPNVRHGLALQPVRGRHVKSVLPFLVQVSLVLSLSLETWKIIILETARSLCS